MQSTNVIFRSLDDELVPNGDKLIIEAPDVFEKVKFLERHDGLGRDLKPATRYIERHCLHSKGWYRPYMIRVYSTDAFTVETILLPKQIEKIKEHLSGSQQIHQTIAHNYLSRVLEMELLEEGHDYLASYFHKHEDVITGLTTIDEDVDRYLYTCTNELMDMVSNIYLHSYRTMVTDNMLIPSITGNNMIDRLTLDHLTDPITYQDMRNRVSKSWHIDMTQPKYLIPKTDVPCEYNLKGKPGSVQYDLYHLLLGMPITDLQIKINFTPSGAVADDPTVALNRYGTTITLKTLRTIIEYLASLCHSSMSSSIYDYVVVTKTYNDEVLFQMYIADTITYQWYWDLSLSALCSNSLIIWP